MHYYFRLQLRRVFRLFESNGMHPYVGIILAAIAFCITCFYLIHQFENGEWYVGAIGVAMNYQLLSSNHHGFLSTLFDVRTTIKVRLIESICVSLPFITVVLGYSFWDVSLAILFLAIVLPFLPIKKRNNIVVPTPFKRIPYEFPVGFRTTLLAFPLAIVPALIGFQVENPNLMLGAILVMTITIMSFGYQPEPAEYVWMHKRTPGQFIWYKLRSTFIGSQIILVPLTILLIALTPSNWLLIALLQLTATIFILALRLAKYAAYPNEIGIAQALLLGLCFWFPPLLVVILPKLFNDSKQRLTSLLT